MRTFKTKDGTTVRALSVAGIGWSVTCINCGRAIAGLDFPGCAHIEEVKSALRQEALRTTAPAPLLDSPLPVYDTPRTTHRWGWPEYAAALLAGLIVLWIVAATSSSDDADSIGDASAQIACGRFGQLTQDVDTLTFPEIRERLQSVYDAARNSTTDGIAETARELLSSATSIDTDRFAAATTRMTNLCT